MGDDQRGAAAHQLAGGLRARDARSRGRARPSARRAPAAAHRAGSRARAQGGGARRWRGRGRPRRAACRGRQASARASPPSPARSIAARDLRRPPRVGSPRAHVLAQRAAEHVGALRYPADRACQAAAVEQPRSRPRRPARRRTRVRAGPGAPRRAWTSRSRSARPARAPRRAAARARRRSPPARSAPGSVIVTSSSAIAA